MTASAQRGGWTPGPWKVDYADQRGGNIVAPSGPVASTRWFGNSHKQVMEDYANAHIIAAAPALYEALAAAQEQLRKAADQFAFYADEHAKKRTPEGDAKGATNMAWARSLAGTDHAARAALAQARGETA